MPEDLLRYAWLDAVALDPTGRQLATVVRSIAPERDGERSRLVVSDLATDTTTTLTGADERVGALAWSRDGRRLAYVVVRFGEPGVGWSLVVRDADGACTHHRPLDGASAPTALDWAPDGRRLVCVRWTPVPASDIAVVGTSPASIRVASRLRYKQDGVGWVQDRFRQLWQVEPDGGRWTQLTSAEADHGEPRFAWSGRQVAFTRTAREQGVPEGYGQLRILDLESGTVVDPMPGWPGLAVSPVWRADDGALAFVGHDFPPPVHRRRFAHLWTLDLATGARADVTAHLDAQVGNYAVSDMRPGLTSVQVAWPAGEGDLWCLVTDRARVHLHRVDPHGGRSERVVEGDGVVFAFSVADDGAVAYGWTDTTTVGDPYLLRDGVARRVEALNPWVADRSLARIEPLEVRTRDGVDVHAWILAAPGGARTPRPAVVQVHCSMFSYGYTHEGQCLAAAGYVVQYANQFGTTAGYGQAHALGNYIGSQHRESGEILAAVDVLAARADVDERRIGVTGGSCGGYMTNWLVTQTDRFAAAVTQRSIADLVSKFGTGDNGPEQATAEGARPPWIDVATLWRNSPIAHVANVTTPVLILHATDDHRCPLPQAEAWFAALRWHGVETELVVFEGESHDLTRAGRPSSRLEHLERLLGWFDRHLVRSEVGA